MPRALAIELSGVLQHATDARGEELSSDEVQRAFEARYMNAIGGVSLHAYSLERLAAGQGVKLRAQVQLAGAEQRIERFGERPLDAFLRALNPLFPPPFEVVDCSEHTRGEGTDAQAVVYVSLRRAQPVREAPPAAASTQTREEPCYGVGRNVDLVLASLQATVSAVNRWLHAE